MAETESPTRIEPTRLEQVPEKLTNLAVQLSAASAVLGSRLHPHTAANLAQLVRVMNTYYSNLIEGHHTRPRDIERALVGDFDQEPARKNLQLEAAAHVRLQAQIDSLHMRNELPEPTSADFIKWLHVEFYRNAPTEFLEIKGRTGNWQMTPGLWRSRPEHDVVVGRHLPPSSIYVDQFMRYFEGCYSQEKSGKAVSLMAIAAAHHRFNFIHPFPDGNGRVSRLMSHAMALKAGIGAHGLWSISRGLARGLASRAEYKQKMDDADSPREGDLDGRGNLSLRALTDFTEWFLRVCLDQVQFMTELFEIETLGPRLKRYISKHPQLKTESAYLLEHALVRGQFERGETARLTGLPERTARRVLAELLALGLLASDAPKGPVSLRFPSEALDDLFPKLYPAI